ncbi:AI-2E family transporter [Candidatus Sulfidibacterium hydrothermale]|uniref:AI-2E family transporter n=1 Tax=Candidatus Sulfidibacterium hydrothermale TaxID=2875962 RepID=UPI001F0A2A88|nr:AI-2E family transporter [Candidatus Sulfidibacterium hydrothermale]UBM62679.1 AI-2E family transporter [Candidatus Sulfidibacterium hydrothermale]
MKHIFISDRLFRVTLFVAASFIIIAGMMMAESFITLILLAVFVSIIGVHPVSWLDRKKVPHWLSVTIVLLGFILIISGLSGIVGSSVSSFTSHLGKYETRLSVILSSINNDFSQYGINLSTDRLTQLFDPAKVLDFTASTLGQLGNVMSNTALIFFIVLFILLEMQSIGLKAKALGAASSKKSMENLTRIEKSVRHYLVIKTFVSLLTGILVGLLLWILGVEYAILWGLIAFLLNYIPNIGSIIAAIPAVMFAWIQLGFAHAVWAMIIFAVVNLMIGYMIEPRVMGKGMGLSTLVVFLSLIVWGYVLGIVGMFLSVPLTMTIKIVLEYNESTRPLAALLGTDEDALVLIEEKKKSVL